MKSDAADVTVSVVIPTRARTNLVCEAVRSALAQTHAPHEVIVVIDGPDDDTLQALRALSDPRVHVESLCKQSGASAARNHGCECATSDLVAFLDDDDRWLPDKLEKELANVASCTQFISFSGVCVQHRDTLRLEPRRRLQHGERIADYLFDHRKLSIGGESVAMTSTFLMPRSTALQVAFDDSAKFHQDWDFLLRADALGVPIVFCDVFATVVDVRHEGRLSISTTTSWRDSLTWAYEHRALLGEKAFAGFCSTIVAYKAFGRPSAYVALPLAIARSHPSAANVARTALQLFVPPRLRRLIRAITGS